MAAQAPQNTPCTFFSYVRFLQQIPNVLKNVSQDRFKTAVSNIEKKVDEFSREKFQSRFQRFFVETKLSLIRERIKAVKDSLESAPNVLQEKIALLEKLFKVIWVPLKDKEKEMLTSSLESLLADMEKKATPEKIIKIIDFCSRLAGVYDLDLQNLEVSSPQDPKVKVPFLMRATSISPKLAQALLEFGFNFHAIDKDGALIIDRVHIEDAATQFLWTAHYVYHRKSRVKIDYTYEEAESYVKALVQKGFQFDFLIDKRPYVAFAYEKLAMRDSESAMMFLYPFFRAIDNTKAINVSDVKGNTALDYAILDGQDNFVQFLIFWGATISPEKLKDLAEKNPKIHGVVVNSLKIREMFANEPTQSS